MSTNPEPTNVPSGATAFVSEAKRKIVFQSGNHLNLRNVTAFNSSGTFLRIWSDEGYILVNTPNVDYMIVTPTGPTV